MLAIAQKEFMVVKPGSRQPAAIDKRGAAVALANPATPRPAERPPAQPAPRRLTLLGSALSAALLLGALGCGAGSDPINTGAVPRFDESRCPFTLHPSQVLGQTARCGDLIVSADRSRGDSPRLRVPVLLFKAPFPGGAPLLQLSGGPGQSWADLGVEKITADQTRGLVRDLAFIEQRGTGVATPSLACPEIPPSSRDLGPQDAAAVAACQARLLQSLGDLKLADFNTQALAADVADLSAVLGKSDLRWRKLQLIGTSYGSLWALTLMRDAPALIDKVILDSVLPPQQPLLKAAASARDGALSAVLTACLADRPCQARFPDLAQQIDDTMSALAQRPLTYAAGPGGRYGAADHYAALDAMLFAAPGLVPLFIDAVRGRVAAGALDPLDARFAAVLGEDPQRATAHLAVGQHLSVLCSDNQQVSDQDLEADAALVRPALRSYARDAIAGLRALCKGWPAQVISDAARFAPVQSAAPVLLLSGALDPRTPPAWGAAALATLSQGAQLTFPGLSHGVLGTSDEAARVCLSAVQLQFLRSGAVADAGCAAQVRPSFSLQ